MKWFDAEKGFGFVAADDGQEIFLHASALPADHPNPRPGTRVEFSVVDGRKGPQAMHVNMVEPTPSLAKAQRRPAAQMVPVVEDLIKLLDHASGALRRGKYPENGRKIATLLRAVADNFDA